MNVTRTGRRKKKRQPESAHRGEEPLAPFEDRRVAENGVAEGKIDIDQLGHRNSSRSKDDVSDVVELGFLREDPAVAFHFSGKLGARIRGEDVEKHMDQMIPLHEGFEKSSRF